MAKTLDEQIEARKQRAVDRNIFAKGSLVARKLGQVDLQHSQTTRDRETLTHVFNDAASSLEVSHLKRVDHISSNVDGSYDVDTQAVVISYKGKGVFSASGHGKESVYAYIPGVWEKKLDAFQPAAQKKVEEEQDTAAQKIARQQAADEAAKRSNWGL